MNNWALVIGIDVYEVDRFRLGGAVSDALAFLHWCVEGDGQVPPGNVNLLLETQPGKVYPNPIPEGIVAQPPTRDNFTRTVQDLLKRSNSTGDRVFFYFAGHGVSARVNGADVPCICLKNFDLDLTNNAVSLPSVFSRFRATRFKEQYFFIDACRNIPFSSEFQVSDFDKPAVLVGDPYPQFVAYATQPRNTAAELVSPNYEGGAFTKALLQALAGQGAAKQWDPENSQYIVRWNSLFKAVERSVLDLKLQSPVPGRSGLIQAPRQYGEKGSEDPILANFEEGKFAPERLRVEFTPPAVGTQVSLSIGEYGCENKEFPTPLSPLPWEIQLPPRIYGVVAKAKDFISKRKVSMVELYGTFPLTIEMLEAPPGLPPSAQSPGVPARFRGITEDFSEPSAGDSDSGGDEALESALLPRRSDGPPGGVFSSDRLVQMEIADQSGRVLVVGRGELNLPPGTGPGLFRVRIVQPDGVFNETLIELSAPGRAPAVLIDPEPPKMTPAVSWAITQSNMPSTPGGLLMPSEAIGAAAFVKLSTLLALAAGARVEGSGPGEKLRHVPLPPSGLPAAFAENQGGLMILMGDELLEVDWTTGHLSVSPADAPDALQELPIKSSPGSNSIVGTDAVLASGSYWLSLEPVEGVSGKMAVCVLPNRITLVVLTREADRNLDLHQYSLWLPSTAVPEPSYLDPEYKDARFAVIRRIELMQRTYVGGRTSLSKPDIDALIYQKWIDPIAGCLGGYMLVSTGRATELGIPSSNLTEHFSGLPDAWVLRACCFEAGKREADVQSAVRNALAAGVPIFADGVRKLAQLARQWTKDDPRTELTERLAKSCVDGGIFSVFLPRQLSEAISGGEALPGSITAAN